VKNILNPVDLAVSKIARFIGKDREDIEQLARFQLINAEEVERQELEKSAALYAEVYAEDEELQQLTDAAIAHWPS
jgi:cell shape-determining protein MreC